MRRIQRDEAVMSSIQSDGKYLLGSAADVYNKDGRLNKRHRDQLNRLGLMTLKAAPTNSYTLQVYAVEPDALFKPL